jgi:hypothetical protein
MEECAGAWRAGWCSEAARAQSDMDAGVCEERLGRGGLGGGSRRVRLGGLFLGGGAWYFTLCLVEARLFLWR